MEKPFAPVGSALPPRRDQVVTAAADPQPASPGIGDSWSINVPRARDRMLEFFEREQLPGDVKATLAAALNGDLHYQHLLFIAMIDSWPKLQSNIGEIARLVSIAPWKVVPFALRGQDPTPKAEKLAKEVEEIVWRMNPDVKRGENDLEGLIASFATGYFMGHCVEESRWENSKDGSWKIRATKPLPARYYGYPYDERADDPEDRLMLDPEGSMGTRNFIDFPDNRFLIGINKGHPGHPSVAAPLRALAAYWLSAVYGLKWFMNFTQLYGIPWRHAEVADSTQDNVVGKMLSEIGSRGYVITRPGTKIHILEAAKGGGNSLPQRELIDLADKQCDTFILGQTLTSGTDDSGSRALGEVHEGTKNARVDAVADWVGRILTYQLLPAIVAVNWGERDDVPEMWAKREEVKDETALAERDEKVGVFSGKLPVAKSWVYERHGIPMPADGDELFLPASEESTGNVPYPGQKTPENPGSPDGGNNPAGVPEMKKVKAADAGVTWRKFPANSGTLGIPRSEMPQIASGNRAAMVGFLKARGIGSQEETVQADSLKPTQVEYSPEKVKGAMEFKGGNRAILISADDHVVDGHHQWQASVEKGEDIRIIRLMAPISRVLMMAHRMPSTRVAAADASTEPETVDRLAETVLEDLTGVTREWLSPVRPAFERLAALAMSKHVTDEDFLAALEKSQREMPELFDKLDTASLETAFEDAIGTAMLAGSVKRYES